jgi:hypothetical protein
MSERGDGPDGKGSDAPVVDVTLIDEMLRMTVRQRPEENDRMAALAVGLRAVFHAREAVWKSHDN